MKIGSLILAGLAAALTASPAPALSLYIDGTHGGSVRLPNFDEDIVFSMEVVQGRYANFAASAFGQTYADPRFCAAADPNALPLDCTQPVDPVFADADFSVTAGGIVPADLWMPFFCCGVNGKLTFSATDGDTVRIMIDALPAPEPTSWALLACGLGMVGGAVRFQRTSASRAGPARL